MTCALNTQINNILKIGCSGYNKPMTDCSTTQMAALHSYGIACATPGCTPEFGTMVDVKLTQQPGVLQWQRCSLRKNPSGVLHVGTDYAVRYAK